MNQFSLYLDHQAIAPLIHTLEDIVQLTKQQHPLEYETYELRLPIYQEFISIVHSLYQERHPNLKLEDINAKLQNIPPISPSPRMPPPSRQRPKGRPKNSNKPQKSYKPSMKEMELEINLIEWIISSGKKIVEKREIDQKYQELTGHRRAISLNKLKTILQNYGLRGLVIRTKTGEDHCISPENDYSVSVVKREEVSRQASMEIGAEEAPEELAELEMINELDEPIKEECSYYLQESEHKAASNNESLNHIDMLDSQPIELGVPCEESESCSLIIHSTD